MNTKIPKVMDEITEFKPVFTRRQTMAKAALARGDVKEVLYGGAKGGVMVDPSLLDEGELEIGQVSGQIDDAPPVAEVMRRLLEGYDAAAARLALARLRSGTRPASKTFSGSAALARATRASMPIPFCSGVMTFPLSSISLRPVTSAI